MADRACDPPCVCVTILATYTPRDARDQREGSLMASTVPAQLLAAIKARKYTSVARMFANGVDFQAWTPSGHWVAQDGATAAKIIEVWCAPGAGPASVAWSNESSGARGSATLEFELT